jgi:hypothetical protein
MTALTVEGRSDFIIIIIIIIIIATFWHVISAYDNYLFLYCIPMHSLHLN